LLTEYKDSATGQFLLSEATINNYKLLFFETQYNNISDSSAAPAPNRVDTHVAYAA